MQSSNIKHIPGLDHIRAFAALLIIFYHGLHILSFLPRTRPGQDITQFWISTLNPLTALIEEGHTAVALFMVLSGFVFEMGAFGKEVLYWSYIKNRFLRIYPLFIVMLVVGLAANPNLYSLSAVVQSLTFQASFPGAVNADPFTLMFWAVAVEFQFYLIFPFLHRFIEKDGLKWALGLIVIAIIFRYFAYLGGANPRDISYWHITGRIDQFIIGMIFARWYRSRSNTPSKAPFFIGALILTLATIVGFNQLGGYPTVAAWKLFWPTIEGTIWAIFLVAYLPIGSLLPKIISSPLIFIGTLSYSMYLLHFIFLRSFTTIIPYRFPANLDLHSQLYTGIIILPALIAVSALSYYVIERPFLNMRVRYLK